MPLCWDKYFAISFSVLCFLNQSNFFKISTVYSNTKTITRCSICTVKALFHTLISVWFWNVPSRNLSLLGHVSCCLPMSFLTTVFILLWPVTSSELIFPIFVQLNMTTVITCSQVLRFSFLKLSSSPICSVTRTFPIFHSLSLSSTFRASPHFCRCALMHFRRGFRLSITVVHSPIYFFVISRMFFLSKYISSFLKVRLKVITLTDRGFLVIIIFTSQLVH